MITEANQPQAGDAQHGAAPSEPALDRSGCVIAARLRRRAAFRIRCRIPACRNTKSEMQKYRNRFLRLFAVAYGFSIGLNQIFYLAFTGSLSVAWQAIIKTQINIININVIKATKLVYIKSINCL